MTTKASESTGSSPHDSIAVLVEQQQQQQRQAPKKRRLRGSCDSCAHRKIKCDAALVGPGNSCSNCITFNTRCTKERGGRHDEFSSARSLIASVSRNKTYTPPNSLASQRKHVLDLVSYVRHLERSYASLKNAIPPNALDNHPNDNDVHVQGHTSSASQIDYEPDEDELIDLHTSTNTRSNPQDEYLEVPGNIVAGYNTYSARFFGTLSNPSLIKHAFEELDINDTPVCEQSADHPSRRPKFWESPPWCAPLIDDEPRDYEFPPPDLLNSLVDLYFIYVSPYLPLLRQPNFAQSVSDGLHYRNPRFADLLLAVCALASRHSRDPRIEYDGLHHSAGWKYFCQIRLSPNFAKPISLFELQTSCICICYLSDAPPPLGSYCWPILGISIRLAQDIGLHRLSGPPTPTTEPWRRAFWVLICIDIILSASFGRPRATNITDYDLSPAAEIDDDCWDTFEQPKGQPSTLAYFNQTVKLFHILALAQRTLFAVRKPAKSEAKNWITDSLQQINSELAKWSAELPNHLRWDPEQQDPVFFIQAAYLQACKAWIIILCHRPFIPIRSTNAPFSLSALAESVNAARICANTLYALHERSMPMSLPQFLMALFSSGVILILQLRMGARRGLSTDVSIDLNHIEKIMKMLKDTEVRIVTAGRFHDVLQEMFNFDPSTDAEGGSLVVAVASGLPKTHPGFEEPSPPSMFGDSPGSSTAVKTPVSPPPSASPTSQQGTSQPGISGGLPPWDPNTAAFSFLDGPGISVPDFSDFSPQQMNNANWDWNAVVGGGLSAWESLLSGSWNSNLPNSMPTYLDPSADPSWAFHSPT